MIPHPSNLPARMPRAASLATAGAAVIVAGFAAAFAVTPCAADDAQAEFSAANNLAGARWNYGWAPNLGGAVTLYTVPSTDGFQLQYWRRNPDNGSYAVFNPNAGPRTPSAGITIPAKSLGLQPGATGQFAVVRWTAVAPGSYSIAARFLARSTTSTPREVAVLRGGELIFSRYLIPAIHGNGVSMSASLELTSGESVDFAVGPGDGANTADLMGLDATVNWEPPDSAGHGPVMRIGEERFVVGRWAGSAFDEIAFDPVSRRLAAQGKIQSLCGAQISDGPGNGVGLAWDPVTLTYWQVDGNRTVRRWSAAGVLLDTVFTVPLTFTVPGTGLDTLESVRGIALDPSFVYFVDAGANPGEISSNAWFKFGRDGSPLKSSKSTDLLAFLDMDPDALVDDIVWVPASSPVFPGRLIVALEHSGFQVLDVEGNFVDRFRWSAEALAPKTAVQRFGKIQAFAGLAVDPLTGALYLVNNDTGTAQVWIPLPRAAPARYAVATGGPEAWLVSPLAGCALKLWEDYSTEFFLPFGLAYRPANRTLYSVDFGDGDLWRVSPRAGNAARVGPTGAPNIWGVAYDPGRDLLYAGIETGGGGIIRVMALDPVTGEGSLLPSFVGYGTTDLAFSTADSGLYGVIGGSPPKLVRIDRDTGVGAIVGNTVYVRGLDYDPVTGRLWGLEIGGNLHSIDPLTGAAESLGVLSGAPNEGLAIVSVPIHPAWVGVEARIAPATTRLAVWPNPARAAATLAFDLERPAEVVAEVFDVQGRRVREIARGTRFPGRHLLSWDGAASDGRPAGAGVYFVRVEAGGHARVARLVRVR